MSAEFKITKGLDLPILGAPGTEIRSLSTSGTRSVYPGEFAREKFKCAVKEGDTVTRGGVVAHGKRIDGFAVRSPIAGTVKEVRLGERRALAEVVIEPNGKEDVESFPSFTLDGVLKTEKADLLKILVESGFLGLIRQRPFSRIADPEATPKSIFVNGMSTAPFRPDAHVLIQGRADDLQVGLNALTRLTDGPVHLNLASSAKEKNDALTEAANVQVNYFQGPHPSGNTSTHIHYLDPIVPEDVVWTLRVSDVIRIGELLRTGLYPNRQRILVAGEGCQEEFRGYFDVDTGMDLSEVIDPVRAEGAQRVIRGDVLAGQAVDTASTGIFLYDQGFVLLPEDTERHLMGWYAPTTEQYSAHKVVPSNWIKDRLFHFGTNTRGSKRAMVLTGIYDPYTPLDLLVDPLSRACIAGETEDAIAMGILETDPEDFALCTFVCPSKTDFGAIVSRTLASIEEEGI
jgi:Na+-transporting NADH:ubiquinone oxidoreductase subunit A